MKKISVALLFLFFPLLLNAQSGNVLLSKFGGAGGFEVFYFAPNFSGLNSALTQSGLPEMGNGILTYGGGGYSYILVIPNVRIGGVGFGGSKSVSGVVNNYYKSAEYHIGGGGVTIEYTFPQIKFMQLSIGATLGGGSTEIVVNSRKSVVSWSQIWDDFNSSSKTKSYNIKSKFFLFSPSINGEILLSRFAALRIGVGYQFAVGESLTAFDEVELSGVPSNLNSQSFFINAGIMVGLFIL